MTSGALPSFSESASTSDAHSASVCGPSACLSTGDSRSCFRMVPRPVLPQQRQGHRRQGWMAVSERGFEPTLAVATHIHQHKLPPRELLGEVALDKWDPVLASTENAVKDPACWLVRTKLLDARGSRHLVVCRVAVLAHQIEARGPIVPCGHCPSPCPPKRRVLHAPQPSLPQIFACCIPSDKTCTSPPQDRPSHQEHFQGQRRRLCGEISASCPAHFSQDADMEFLGSPTTRSPV